MHFAINYSPEAAQLLDQGLIQVDYYKCWADTVEPAQAQRPVYVHFPLMAGRGQPQAMSLDAIEALTEATNTPYINTHIAPLCTDFGIEPGSLKVQQVDAITERILADVQVLVDRFGAERVILENAPYPDRPPYDIPIVPVDVIYRIVDETGVGLLLDTAHADLTCRAQGLDIYDYLSSLPVHRLRELHVAGVQYDEASQRHLDHYALTAHDWRLVEWVIERIRSGIWATPWLLAFEYGAPRGFLHDVCDINRLTEQTPQLYELAKLVR